MARGIVMCFEKREIRPERKRRQALKSKARLPHAETFAPFVLP